VQLPGGVMIRGFGVRTRVTVAAFAVACAGIVAAPPSALAQEASDDLKDLRQIVRGLVIRGDHRAAFSFKQEELAAAIRDFGPDHEEVLRLTEGLALSANFLREWEASREAYQRAIAIIKKREGKNSFRLSDALVGLGKAHLAQGRAKTASKAFYRAGRIAELHRGAAVRAMNAPYYGHLAVAALKGGKLDLALEIFRAIDPMITDDVARHVSIALDNHSIIGFAQAIEKLAKSGKITKQAAFDQSLGLVQRAWRSSVGYAIAQMAEKASVLRPEKRADLARLKAAIADWEAVRAQRKEIEISLRVKQNKYEPLIRKKAEQRAERQRIEKLMSENRARRREIYEKFEQIKRSCIVDKPKEVCVVEIQPDLDVAKARIEPLRQERKRLFKALGRLDSEIEDLKWDMPGAAEKRAAMDRLSPLNSSRRKAIDELQTKVYGSKTVKPFEAQFAPVSLATIQSHLKEGEALVVALPGDYEGHVWFVSKDRVASATMEMRSIDMMRALFRLHPQLDPEYFSSGSIPKFDFELSHRIYRSVFGGLEKELKNTRHIYFVPFGYLSQIAPQVLVREVPDERKTEKEKLRTAGWLARDFSFSVLPSIQSFHLIRTAPQAKRAAKAYLGVANPVLEGRGPEVVDADGRVADFAAAKPLYRSGAVDVAAVRELEPLPDTEDEVRSVGRGFGAPNADYLIGGDANETRLKALKLDQYRVLHFATHGLMKGQLGTLDEPALVLTPPEEARDDTDGLLHATEIAALDLNADWVVLSACNTAASSDVLADPFSGLASAFFIAGARTLMVSHWAVISQAAVELTTGTFRRLRETPGLGRSEALRRAMVEAIEAGRHPSYWAPFVVVGDGGALPTN
jgi:CHAT domain-containing protein